MPKPAKTRLKTPQNRPTKRKSAKKARRYATSKTVIAGVRPGTKQALLMDLLTRKAGATIDEIVEATGWQAHSVRGAMSGTLKKKLGLIVTSKTVEGRGRVYRIGDGR